MKKLLKLFLLFISILSINVKAKEYSETFIDKTEWISGDYVNKEKGGSTKYQQMYTIKRKSDGKFVYCISLFILYQIPLVDCNNNPLTGFCNN